ncbi:hypothetical protein BU16DRAFT_557185 [Lophium mytilinum]|uniref:Uncharacterized protein n=1 Tax=Lophium mytilinum TaxID=390894 RepID=A0A6A6RAF4_9PEZI|nr:hypothetical protein BU16DRAFT_557185 [Lophium mytilinum]
MLPLKLNLSLNTTSTQPIDSDTFGMSYEGYVQDWCDECKTRGRALKYLVFHDQIICSNCREQHVCDHLSNPLYHPPTNRWYDSDPYKRLEWMGRFARQLSADAVTRHFLTRDALTATGLPHDLCPSTSLDSLHALWAVLSSAYEAIGPRFAASGHTTAEWCSRAWYGGMRACVRFTVAYLPSWRQRDIPERALNVKPVGLLHPEDWELVSYVPEVSYAPEDALSDWIRLPSATITPEGDAAVIGAQRGVSEGQRWTFEQAHDGRILDAVPGEEAIIRRFTPIDVYLRDVTERLALWVRRGAVQRVFRNPPFEDGEL